LLTCDETRKGVRDSPLPDTQHTTDMCLRLRLRCTPWWLVWPDIETGTITFRATRSSYSDIPTSSKLNIKSAQPFCTCCLRHSTIVSRNDRGISSCGFSWGRRIVSTNSVWCRIRKESTLSSVTAAPRVSQQ
jgi:hypothetical protein